MPALTTAAVAKYKATAARREIPDSRHGLYLVVQPSGQKSWALRFRRPDGVAAKFTLGTVDLGDEPADTPVIGGPLTLAMARELAASIARERARGVDVIADHKAKAHRAQTAAAATAANTFGKAIREFVVDHKTKWHARPRRWRDEVRVLGLHYAPGCDPATTNPDVIPGSLAATWGGKPLAAVDAHDVHTAVDEARRHGIPGLGRRNGGVSEARGRKMYAALSVFFRWAVQRRKVTVSPVAGVWRPGAPPSRERVLTATEIVAFWRGCEAMGWPFGPLFQLLLLTGARLGEVTGIRTDELSDDGATWTIPGTRTKNHRAHVVPLPPQAQVLIAAVPQVAGLLFTTNGARPVSGFSKAKQQLDAAMGVVPPWTLHDLRRTAATGMAELGIAPHIIEACLNHISGARGGVAGIYNRATYAAEKKAALERWAAHVTGLCSGQGARVLPLRRGR